MSKQQRTVVLVISLLHIFALFIFYFYITSSAVSPSDRIWYWMIWSLIDFPFLIILASVVDISGSISTTYSIDTVLLLFHGTVATAWWGFIGHFINVRFFNEKSKKGKKNL